MLAAWQKAQRGFQKGSVKSYVRHASSTDDVIIFDRDTPIYETLGRVLLWNATRKYNLTLHHLTLGTLRGVTFSMQDRSSTGSRTAVG